MALALSVVENAEVARKREASRCKVRERLAKYGLQRLETPADGNCQFLSVLYTAEIPLDVNVFRAEVVGFLRSLPQRFEEKVSKHFRSFDQYLEHMERPNSWGDELTLQAASCLLMQPIRVVSDCDAESEHTFSNAHQRMLGCGNRCRIFRCESLRSDRPRERRPRCQA